MISETVNIIVFTSKNISGKPWYPVLIPYHDGEDRATYTPFHSNTIIPKYPEKAALGLTWNKIRDLLDISIFNNREEEITPQEKNHNVNSHFLFNGSPEEYSTSIRKFKEKLRLSIPRIKFLYQDFNPIWNLLGWDTSCISIIIYNDRI